MTAVLPPEHRPTQPAAVENDQFLSDLLPKVMLEAQSKSFAVDGHSVRIPGVHIIDTYGQAQYNFQDSEHTCLMHDCKERKEWTGCR